MSTGFPLSGVIGIVATGRDEIDLAVDAGLGSVEVRADLLLQAGMSTAALIDTVAYARQRQMACRSRHVILRTVVSSMARKTSAWRLLFRPWRPMPNWWTRNGAAPPPAACCLKVPR